MLLSLLLLVSLGSAEHHDHTGASAGIVINVKAHGAVGDGHHDDTNSIAAALTLVRKANHIYFYQTSFPLSQEPMRIDADFFSNFARQARPALRVVRARVCEILVAPFPTPSFFILKSS